MILLQPRTLLLLMAWCLPQATSAADFGLLLNQFATGRTDAQLRYQGSAGRHETTTTVVQNGAIFEATRRARSSGTLWMINNGSVRANVRIGGGRQAQVSNTAGNLVVYSEDAGLRGITDETRALSPWLPKWKRDQIVARRHNIAGNVIIYDPVEVPRRFLWTGQGAVHRHGDCAPQGGCGGAAVTAGAAVLVESGRAQGPIFPVIVNRSPVSSHGLSAGRSSQTAGALLMMESGGRDSIHPMMLNNAQVSARQ